MGRRDGERAAAMPKRGLVLERRSAAQRKTDRRALGSLQSLVVAPSTRGRYFQAVSRFLEFLQLHGYGYPCTFSSLDGRVCEFIEYLWHNGEPKAFASDCLSGLGHFIPATKKHLVGGGVFMGAGHVRNCRLEPSRLPLLWCMPLPRRLLKKVGKIYVSLSSSASTVLPAPESCLRRLNKTLSLTIHVQR